MKTIPDVILAVLLFVCLRQESVNANRKVSMALNPNCPRHLDCAHYGLEHFPNSANSLLYFVAEPCKEGCTSNQTAHILFSSVGGPAILMLLTDKSSAVKIDWPRYLNEEERGKSVTVGGRVRHSMAVMFSRIWRFNDASDVCIVDSPSPSNAIEAIALEKLLWRNVTITNGTLSAILGGSGDGEDQQLLGSNGTVRVTIEVFDSVGRSSNLPRLPHTDIGCQLDIELVNVNVGNFTQPRFAVETMAVSHAALSTGGDYSMSVVENIDDEYTPGVFRTYYLTMPGDDGYVAWKPVAYRSSSRSFDSFTRAKHGDAKLVANISSFSTMNMSNLIAAYYGSSFPLHAVAFNMTLGLQKDKFYTNYRYLVWSLVIGWGSKPSESLSTLILTLLIVCGVFPLLALFIGLPYLIIRRKRQALPYEDLIEDT